ncbi:hypothetical protein I7F96_25090 [Sinorhizobium meliloti]|nr:hypothetical protein [Sinorhizobium meliloti]MDE3774207.1 hypothetical protein [Sinorhizobium meliloti]
MLFIEHDSLSVDYGRLHGEPSRVVSNRREPVGPVVAAARENSHLAGLDVHGQPVAGPLHLVGPVLPGRAFIDERRKAGIDTRRHGIRRL